MGTIGRPPGGDAYPADRDDLDSYRRAHAALEQLRVPVLVRSDNPHERLFVAALDGTGNSLYDDKPENWSAVARIFWQIETTRPANIAAGYVEGTFTQNGVLRTPERLWDGRFAHTFNERVETAYYQLCEQAWEWLKQDPNAQIRVVGLGFSRGSEEAAALLRMIEERGIRDPTDARVLRDSEGLITRIEYADRPPLVPPGKTLQAALLFDPVATGAEDHDRRLPASALSTFQISAQDEKRNLFPVSDHVPPGFSEDCRNLNVTVGGAHSDIGNTYQRNGLGVLSFNLGVAFLNRLSDRPFLREQPVPDDPSMYVVHRSELGMAGLYRTSFFDRTGERRRVVDQSPATGIQGKDPIDAGLDALIERRPAPGAPPGFGCEAPQPAAPPTSAARSPADDLLDRALAAYMSDDGRAFSQVMAEYRRTPDGQAWERQQAEFVRVLREAAAPAPQPSIEPPAEPPAMRAPAMRM
ncbi:phospholipase effector Tle1 domain-containing protein [Vulcaniibacterium thermophilum]|uniref:T6SS Phospholipase effector Tle1-like catalytic domain-containing protein n=2 Tax=Vulcaniibacterium thermophilum TaxID=1169913 RepID=A0A918ZAE3_9GAMM|nr:DUF2235 domain-containing protein [Vulcaniibacterium thermophilum]GHE42246.1 hypothetical protein GCM10007167_25150 [Vulcaniibacterium thermophilum]